MNNSAQPVNPLQEDIQALLTELLLPRTSKRSRDLAFQRLLAIVASMEYEKKVARLQSSFKVEGLFGATPDRDLARLVSTECYAWSSFVTRNVTREFISNDSNALEFVISGDPSEEDDRFQLLHGVIRRELFEEFWRRRDTRETEDGRRIRELLVQVDERGNNLQTIASRIAVGLSMPGDRELGKREAHSVAVVEIWERVKPFVDIAPNAHPEALFASLRGEFNQTLEVSRQAVRNAVRTDLRRRTAVWSENELREFGSEDESGSFNLEDQGDPRANQAFQFVEGKILLEQAFVKSDLTRHEATLIVECCFRQRNQAVVAKEQGTSQAKVSRDLQKAVDKLSSFLSSSKKTS